MEEPLEQPKKNSLAGLVILAQYHSIAVDEGDITHRFNTESNSIDQTAWLLAAKDIGLKVRVIKQKTDRLHLIALPALVWKG